MHARVRSACSRTRFLALPIVTSCLIAVFLLPIITSVGGAQTLTRFSLDSWSSTTNYLGFAEFGSAIDVQIRITAADSYSLYVNGDFVGSDDDPNTVETYDVSYKRRTNQIAVVVNHRGSATGFGLFCVLEAEGVSLEVIDPRTLVPLDIETILNSVDRTGRLVVVDPAHQMCSAGSQIAANVAQEGFWSLQALIQVVASEQVNVPYSPALEPLIYPTPEKVVAAVRTVLD